MNRPTKDTMVRALFLFDMVFWLFLAALTLSIAYLFAHRTVITLAPAGHSTGSRMDEPETFIIGQQGVIRAIVIRPRDWTKLDSLQVLTKWLDVTPKVADAQQSDRRARKG
jgi:hypothetical protein